MSINDTGLTDAIIQTLANKYVEIIQLPFCNGSMGIYPDENDENNRKLCTFAYAAASAGKVTIQRADSRSIAQLVIDNDNPLSSAHRQKIPTKLP